MKILHLTSSVSKQSAAYRLHEALLHSGVDSHIMVAFNSMTDRRIIHPKSSFVSKVNAFLDRVPLRFFKNVNGPFNVGWKSNNSLDIINNSGYDIVHLHWINQFVSISDLGKIRPKIIWTLHDSWPFTGGCHIPYDCQGWLNECGDCPVLGSGRKNDLSNSIHRMKSRYWNGIDVNIIGPSRWMTGCVQDSSLFKDRKVCNVPNTIDVNHYQPKSKVEARQLLKLPLDKKIVLFGANNATRDRNKGLDILRAAFVDIKSRRNDIELVIFGSEEVNYLSDGIREIGKISESEIFPFLYSAADVVVNASRSENFSNVILESLSCGTPVVAFDIGGNSDLIDHKETGYLALPYDSGDLSVGIQWALSGSSTTSQACRQKVIRHFSYKRVAEMHLEVYNSLIN